MLRLYKRLTLFNEEFDCFAKAKSDFSIKAKQIFMKIKKFCLRCARKTRKKEAIF